MKLLLLSNSTNPDDSYLNHALPWISNFLSTGVKTIAFIPYAGVTIKPGEYLSKVKAATEPMGYQILHVPENETASSVIRKADAIAVGGGNTFRLLKTMQQWNLISTIREEVLNGKPYIGWSAGSNVAAPTIKTTNDMPVVQPDSFTAIGLVPFQINPHYLDAHPDHHMGETREQRLLEFLEENQSVTVIGLREGSALSVNQSQVTLLGSKTARLFRYSNPPAEISAGASWTF
ncbi:MAG: dipeptidase PepE [Bacteroidetes bacterium]|nr:dipeptidase PepE [Bacteroidota bacterium]